MKKSSYHCRFRYPYRLNKCIEDKITNGYINAINSRNNSFEFIFNLIETELKKEAEILNNNNNNKRLLRVLNNKKLLRPLNIPCQSNSDRRNPITPELKF